MVIEVHFNWHTHPEHGCNFEFYRVGENYSKMTGNYVKCEDITISFKEGMHAVIQFDDGTVEKQWNINKIIEAEDGVFKVKNNQGDNEGTELS